MVSRQQQHYKTYCWHDPHEAWSPNNNNIRRHAAGSTTCTKHDLQRAIKLQDILLALPERSMVSRQQQNYKTYCWHDPHEAWSPDSNKIARHTAGSTLMKHGLQTATKLPDMLLAQPARSMVSRQLQNCKTCCWHDPHQAWSPDSNKITIHTYCWHDPHKAWSPDNNKITRHTAGTTRTKHGLQTATKLQDIPLA